jgi:peptidoglycan-associated lipoprotein
LEIEFMNARTLLLIAVTGLVVAACSGSDTLPPVSVDDGLGGPGGARGAETSAVDGRVNGNFVPFEGEQPGDREQLGNLVVYFEFDRSEVRSDFNALLAAHGRYLASDRNLSIRLEGHADERGSREYNIGLGENRAQAVRQILLLQGVSAAQLSTVSYGEERPAAFGSDEESYGLNRRVELVYR